MCSKLEWLALKACPYLMSNGSVKYFNCSMKIIIINTFSLPLTTSMNKPLAKNLHWIFNARIQSTKQKMYMKQPSKTTKKVIFGNEFSLNKANYWGVYRKFVYKLDNLPAWLTFFHDILQNDTIPWAEYPLSKTKMILIEQPPPPPLTKKKERRKCQRSPPGRYR